MERRVIRNSVFVFCLASVLTLGSIGAVFSQEVLTEKQISLGLARDAAMAAIEQARKDGYRVSVTVVNRAGQVIAQLRDDGASPHTAQTSWRKAYTALIFRAGTTEIATRIANNPAVANLREITDVTTLGGGLPIRAGNEVIGAIGVGGAPGGDKDEVCAQAGIDKISAKLK
jgi:uncharacterized protein GlcG (DUF336 family)